CDSGVKPPAEGKERPCRFGNHGGVSLRSVIFVIDWPEIMQLSDVGFALLSDADAMRLYSSASEPPLAVPDLVSIVIRHKLRVPAGKHVLGRDDLRGRQ